MMNKNVALTEDRLFIASFRSIERPLEMILLLIADFS